MLCIWGCKRKKKESKKDVKEPKVSSSSNYQEKFRLMDDLIGSTTPNQDQKTQKSSDEKKKSSDQIELRKVNQTQDSGRVNSESPNSGEKKKMQKTTEYWDEDSNKLLMKEAGPTVTEYAVEADFGYSRDGEPRPVTNIFLDVDKKTTLFEQTVEMKAQLEEMVKSGVEIAQEFTFEPQKT